MSVLTDRIRALHGSGEGTAFDRRLIAPIVLGALLNPVNSSMLAVALVPIGIAFGAPPSDRLARHRPLPRHRGGPAGGRPSGRPVRPAPAVPPGSGSGRPRRSPRCRRPEPRHAGPGPGPHRDRDLRRLPRRDVPHPPRGRQDRMPSPSGILAALAVSTQVTAVIGPTLGGFLIGVGGWRTIFLVNVPLALASLVLGWRRLPRIPTAPPDPDEPTGLDVPGILAFAVALVTLMLFLTTPDLGRWYLLVIALAAGIAFGWRELARHHRSSTCASSRATSRCWPRMRVSCSRSPSRTGSSTATPSGSRRGAGSARPRPGSSCFRCSSSAWSSPPSPDVGPKSG